MSPKHPFLSRRSTLLMGMSGALLPTVANADKPAALTIPKDDVKPDGPPALSWEDLIPPGTPYSEIIAEGEIDRVNDRWKPVFDEHGTKLNHKFDGQTVQISGFIVPFGVTKGGVREFLLAPRQSVCSHVAPPPPNQIVLASSEEPIPSNLLWAAVRMTGTLKAEPLSTSIAEVGYQLSVDQAEMFFG